jgi:hypothetical protein
MNGKGQGLSEDLLALIIGLIIFVLALGLLGGVDLLGWVITTSVWTDLSKALAPISKAYAGLGGIGSLVATYVGLLVLMTAGAAVLRAHVGRFALAFTAVFWISYICWIIGSYANFAVNTPADLQKFGISWSLRLTADRSPLQLFKEQFPRSLKLMGKTLSLEPISKLRAGVDPL